MSDCGVFRATTESWISTAAPVSCLLGIGLFGIDSTDLLDTCCPANKSEPPGCLPLDFVEMNRFEILIAAAATRSARHFELETDRTEIDC